MLAALRARPYALPTPVEFASSLWVWANSQDWRDQPNADGVGRFVPTAAVWVKESRWKRVPRDRSALELDTGGGQRRRAVAEILGVPIGAVA